MNRAGWGVTIVGIMARQTGITSAEPNSLVSVVVPAYNVAKYIGSCLDCLLRQSYEDFEIIVVDDCSTDETWQIALEYSRAHPRVTALRNPLNLGQAATRNRCLAVARGSYVMLQDADDLCEDSRVERLIAVLSSSDRDFVSSGYYLFDDEDTYKVVVPRVALPSRRDFLYGSPFVHAACMFKRACLDSAGGYRVSKETRRGEDYDLLMRLYALGFRGVNLPDILYGYRVDCFTLARRKFAYRLDECRIRRRGFSQLGLMPWGMPFVAKPLLAHVLQMLQSRQRHV